MNLQKESAEFTGYLENWYEKLPILKFTDAVQTPEKTAVISVDVINGFCYSGALSSPRVADIVSPITDLFIHLKQLGVNHFVLAQDTHDEDAVEFANFPPHCLRGTSESETVNAFKALPFFSEFHIFPKNSIHSGLGTGLGAWLDLHPQVDTFIVVGDCTDLCVYQLAMYLRLDANARQIKRRVILPVNCVQTYDTPVPVAVENHIPAHPGDLLHIISLYHMFMNGIEIFTKLE